MKKTFAVVLILIIWSVVWPLHIVTLLTMSLVGAIVALGGGSTTLFMVSLEAFDFIPQSIRELKECLSDRRSVVIIFNE